MAWVASEPPAMSNSDADAVRRGKALARLIRRRLGEGATEVLDIGCGEGGLIRGFLAETSAFGVGLDIEKQLIIRATASRSDDASPRFLVADGRSLPFGEATFDVVALFDVLEHVGTWEAVVAESARVLRPGGVAYVTAANTRSLITVLDDPHWHVPFIALLPRDWSRTIVRVLRLGDLDMGGEHPAFPSWSDLERAFQRAGFEVELISIIEKLIDPEGVVSPWRRKLARALSTRWKSSGFSGLALALIPIYDRAFARGWSFLVRKRANSAGGR